MSDRMDGAGRFSVSTRAYAPGWTAEACLKHLNDMGFHHFGLTMRPGFLWPADMDKAGRAHFRRFLQGHRLRIVCLDTHGAGLDIATASDETRAAALARLESFIELGGELGVQGIVLGIVLGIGRREPGPAPSREQLQGHLFAALDRLGAAAERAGTALWVETTPTACEPAADGLMRLLEAHGDARIGLVYDVANGWFAKEDIGAALRRVAPRLRLVKVSDTVHAAHRHDRIGQGSVPFDSLPALLAEAGYADWPMLDVDDPDPDAAIATSVARLLALGFGNLPAGTAEVR